MREGLVAAVSAAASARIRSTIALFLRSCSIRLVSHLVVRRVLDAPVRVSNGKHVVEYYEAPGGGLQRQPCVEGRDVPRQLASLGKRAAQLVELVPSHRRKKRRPFTCWPKAHTLCRDEASLRLRDSLCVNLASGMLMSRLARLDRADAIASAFSQRHHSPSRRTSTFSNKSGRAPWRERVDRHD